MGSSVNKILTVYILISLPILTWANDDTHQYQKGDCITPVAESYSWHGKYATVKAYSSIEDLTNTKLYILAFPFSGSNSTIFTKEIESVTKKVRASLCGK
jgi:hypothetical protein